jgi:hypothetical protein
MHSGYAGQSVRSRAPAARIDYLLVTTASGAAMPAKALLPTGSRRARAGHQRATYIADFTRDARVPPLQGNVPPSRPHPGRGNGRGAALQAGRRAPGGAPPAVAAHRVGAEPATPRLRSHVSNTTHLPCPTSHQESSEA